MDDGSWLLWLWLLNIPDPPFWGGCYSLALGFALQASTTAAATPGRPSGPCRGRSTARTPSVKTAPTSASTARISRGAMPHLHWVGACMRGCGQVACVRGCGRGSVPLRVSRPSGRSSTVCLMTLLSKRNCGACSERAGTGLRHRDAHTWCQG
jgi:hypothetical protein